jgi:hypothetical protein
MRKAVLVTVVAAVACVSIAVGGSSATAPKAAAATTGPAVTTGYAKGVATTAEQVLGVVNPNGQATTYHFEYGTSTTYGSVTPPVNAGAGIANRPASGLLGALAPNTVYHYRLVASNAGGKAFGDDQSFTSGLTTSQVRVMGREGFVSPGRVIGVELGCFVGQTTCTGHITMAHNGVVIGQRDYSIPPSSGGFHNMRITEHGWRLVKNNSVFNLVGVDVTVNDSTGQTLHYVIHLARWVWH